LPTPRFFNSFSSPAGLRFGMFVTPAASKPAAPREQSPVTVVEQPRNRQAA